MSVSNIHHVQMAIPQGGVLGLTEMPRSANLQGRGDVWFVTGTIQIHPGIDPSSTPATRAHVAFECPDPPALRERLALSACPIVDDEPLLGHTRFYPPDPFGNRVELLSPVKSSASIDDGS